MTVFELKQRLSSHAPGALVPVEWVLEQLGDVTPEFEGVTLCDIHTAAQITGLSPKSLRDRGARWISQRDPEIRTTRSTPGKKGSPFLFSDADCWAYARKNDPTVIEPAPEPDSPERTSIIDRYVDKATAD